ncbi:MAG: acylneuraminate cytidylyltransferase family protein [Candidatus Peribacteraceae bacterium]|nr:acylneuraminate cytidylyltransferase family protein [Candidatus Peribacteraceae bacterium]
MLLSFVVPARGGSQRIPRKNTVPLGGIPLISHTFRLLRTLQLHGVSYVSTEDPATKVIALTEGIQVIDRPSSLATNSSSTDDVIFHALDVLERQHALPAWIVTLPPTSPFRQPATLRRLIGYIESDPQVDCIFAVTKSLKDYWLLREGKPQRVFPDAARCQKGRDEAGDVLFEENSCFYATRVVAFREASARGDVAPILGNTAKMFPVSPMEGFDINDPLDLVIAESLLQYHLRHTS